MAQGGTVCPECASVVAPGTRFCGACGAKVPEPSETPAGSAPVVDPSHTIMGIDAEAVKFAAALAQVEAQAKAKAEAEAEATRKAQAEQVEVAGAAADPDADESQSAQSQGETPPEVAAAEAAVETENPTEGSTAPLDAPGAADPEPTASEPQPLAQPQAPRVITPERGTPAAARAAVQASKRGLAHTMLGLSDEAIKAASAAVQPASLPHNVRGAGAGTASAEAPARAAAKGTLLGIQVSPLEAGAGLGSRSLDQTQIEGEPDVDAPTQRAESGSSAASELSSTRVEGSYSQGPKGTALGLGAPQTAPKRGAPKGRTMLGVPVASISPPGPSTTSGALGGSSSIPAIPADDPYDPASSVPPSAPGRSPARSRNVLILGSLALLSIIVMVLVRLSGSANNADVSARIMTGADGETLLFKVPEARDGARIRFGGQEQPLVDGKATFALASDSLRVGENVVLADVVMPDGATSSARIVLSVFYRISVDSSNLRIDSPTVDVTVTAVPGTKVALEGEAVPLDDQGRATKTYPIDIRKPGKGGVVEHVVHYRMEPPSGEPVVDELHTRIAVAMMQIDRPGPEIVTDRESIEIAGAVGRETQIDIDGTAVPVQDGRFVHTLALPKSGEYKPRVTAKSTGKIPYAVTLSIKRVRDLAQAAREFSFDKDLNYAKLAAAPAQQRGRPIAMEGRVYATVPRAGASVIQMLARPCPSGQRCSVWVVDPQGTEVTVDRFVRVLGIVDGEQQFRSEKNEIVTVPKIVARFVLPAKP